MYILFLPIFLSFFSSRPTGRSQNTPRLAFEKHVFFVVVIVVAVDGGEGFHPRTVNGASFTNGPYSAFH